jgi:hypothetical protein
MAENLIQVKSFGQLRPETLYSEDVSLSFDTIQHSQNSKIKVLVQIEPPEIINVKNAIISNRDKFDLILAWDKDILDNCPNSKKFIFGTCWINFDTLKINKENEISFIMSEKMQAPGHKIRHTIWSYLNGKNEINGFNIMKFKTPPRIESKNVLFEKAKYHIVVENASRENWVTEKVIDCFATKTIPIYWGCPNIGEFFNEEGVIKFNTLEELDSILNNLDLEYYEKLQNVIEENYEKSKQYYDFHKRVENEINNIIYNNIIYNN